MKDIVKSFVQLHPRRMKLSFMLADYMYLHFTLCLLNCKVKASIAQTCQKWAWQPKNFRTRFAHHWLNPPFWSATVVVWRKIKIKTTFLEFFILLYWYNWGSKLLYHCAQEAQSTIASQQHINFTVGIIPKVTTSPNVLSYYNAASFAFVAVSAAECLLEISPTLWNRKYGQFFLHKLCDTAAIYSQLRKLS